MARTQYFERNRKTITKNKTITMTTEKTIKYFSMFSGIGGFECGIEKADTETSFECVGYSEIDNYAVKIYEKHYPNHINYGDARLINTKDLPNFELLVGGFPCQAFSLAGKRKGFNDTRGTLFFEIARVLKDKRPPYFLLENVKGILSHNKGKTFQVILGVLSELGYNVEWQVLNSAHFGVPQKRERVFIKGYSRRKCGSEILSLPRTSTETDEGVKLKQLNKIIKPLKIATATKKGYDEAFPCDGVRLDYPNGSTGRGRVQKNLAGTLSCGGNWGTVDQDFLIRRLTPVECERLQGFSDDWTKWGKDGELISDTQRYKCLGNAVTTNVVTEIIEEMFQ